MDEDDEILVDYDEDLGQEEGASTSTALTMKTTMAVLTRARMKEIKLESIPRSLQRRLIPQLRANSDSNSETQSIRRHHCEYARTHHPHTHTDADAQMRAHTTTHTTGHIRTTSRHQLPGEVKKFKGAIAYGVTTSNLVRSSSIH